MLKRLVILWDLKLYTDDISSFDLQISVFRSCYTTDPCFLSRPSRPGSQLGSPLLALGLARLSVVGSRLGFRLLGFGLALCCWLSAWFSSPLLALGSALCCWLSARPTVVGSRLVLDDGPKCSSFRFPFAF